MSEESTTLLTNALKLPTEGREEFAAALWQSLDAESGLTDHTDADLLGDIDQRSKVSNSDKLTFVISIKE